MFLRLRDLRDLRDLRENRKLTVLIFCKSYDTKRISEWKNVPDLEKSLDTKIK